MSAATATAIGEKYKYRNTTGGNVGAVRINGRGEEIGVVVEPGDEIWLSEEERRLTAEAPRRAEDNPFLRQEYEVQNPDTLEVLEQGSRPPLELVTDARPTSSPPSERPTGSPEPPPPDEGEADGEEQDTETAGTEPDHGGFQPGEEVGPS